MALIASSGGTKVYRRSPQQLATDKRRADFEKQYSKNQQIFSKIEATPELKSISNNIAEQIRLFKQSKRN